MYVLQPAAAFDCTGSQSSHKQAFPEKIRNTSFLKSCFLAHCLQPLILQKTGCRTMTGPGLLVSSVVASRSEDTKLTYLAEKFGVSALFAPEVLFSDSQRCKPAMGCNCGKVGAVYWEKQKRLWK